MFVEDTSESELTELEVTLVLVGLSALHCKACQLELFGAEKIVSGKTVEETRNRW